MYAVPRFPVSFKLFLKGLGLLLCYCYTLKNIFVHLRMKSYIITYHLYNIMLSIIYYLFYVINYILYILIIFYYLLFINDACYEYNSLNTLPFGSSLSKKGFCCAEGHGHSSYIFLVRVSVMHLHCFSSELSEVC